MLFHISGTAAGARWGMRVGGICFFCFHHQGIWIDAKVVKIWGMRESFAMDILITRTTPLSVFSVFGFRVMIYQRYRNVPNFMFCALFIFR